MSSVKEEFYLRTNFHYMEIFPTIVLLQGKESLDDILGNLLKFQFFGSLSNTQMMQGLLGRL